MHELTWLVTAAGAEPGEATPTATVEGAWSLFSILAILLAVFFIVIATIAALRWSRRSRTSSAQRTSPNDPAPQDAWSEAGKRAEP